MNYIAKLMASASLAFFPMLLVFSCTKQTTNEVSVGLNSLSYDMNLSSTLTYSAFNVIGDTSTHLGRIDKDLVTRKEVLNRYIENENNTVFKIFLDSSYRSIRNERIIADDVKFTVITYLKNNYNFSLPLGNIENSDECRSGDCSNLGVLVAGDYELTIKLNRPDPKFIERLMSPWLVIFKQGMPLYENIDKCVVPYQTGIGEIIECKDGIKIRYKDRIVKVRDQSLFDKNEITVVNENPSNEIYPSLTILGAYFNPSAEIPLKSRKTVVNAIKNNSERISKTLKLKANDTLISSWVEKIKIDSDILHQSSCINRPMKVLLDTSLPYPKKLEAILRDIIPCELKFSMTTADRYFADFSKTDLGILWFSPDEKRHYNFYSSFDCTSSGLCYFNWNDSKLNSSVAKLNSLDLPSDLRDQSKIVESILHKKGYVAAFSQMNWWIKSGSKFISVHPSGIAQARISEFTSL